MMLALSVVSLAMLVSELSSCSYNSSCWIALVSFFCPFGRFQFSILLPCLGKGDLQLLIVETLRAEPETAGELLDGVDDGAVRLERALTAQRHLNAPAPSKQCKNRQNTKHCKVAGCNFER